MQKNLVFLVMEGKHGVSFLVAAFDLSQRKAEVAEKKAQAKQQSTQLLDFTRKALARLTYLKR